MTMLLFQCLQKTVIHKAADCKCGHKEYIFPEQHSISNLWMQTNLQEVLLFIVYKNFHFSHEHFMAAAESNSLIGYVIRVFHVK
jgi:hypothetical protein